MEDSLTHQQENVLALAQAALKESTSRTRIQ
jgi:hypothetical protein